MIEPPRASIAARPLIALVHLYRRTLAHVLGGQCRFHPTCSAYALQALQEHGALCGSWLTLRRIGRCHPWGGLGDDPVPRRKARVEESSDRPA